MIFGAWDIHTDGKTTLILSADWEVGSTGRKQPAFSESREHLRLVEEEGYDLLTFAIEHSEERRDDAGVGPAKIRGFTPKLEQRSLRRIGQQWYASDGLAGSSLPEEVHEPQAYVEGASVVVSINAYERNASARAACLAHYGHACAVCGFSFKATYGEIGEGYIHVHHVVPLSAIGGGYVVDPVADLVPLCPNCHAMIHRTQPALTIEQLRSCVEGRLL